MSWIRYWPIFEMAAVVVIVCLVGWRILRSAKKRAQNPPPAATTPGGGLLRAGVYVLRILGVGLGTLALLVLFLVVERSIFSVVTETMPAPSEVSIPADLGFEVEEVTFPSEDGLQIAGWYSPSQNGAVIILLHGYGGNRTGMIWQAGRLTAAGYGVLMYDERASGESQGDHRSYGWEDPQDVGGALAYLASRGDQRVGIAGCSIGGQIALQGASYYPEIAAVWADGPAGVRARDIRPSNNPIISIFRAGNFMVDWAYMLRLQRQPPPAIIDIIGNIEPRPAMLILGGRPREGIGSEAELNSYFLEFAGEHAGMWVIPEATHCDGPMRRPEEYEQRMIVFFDTAFDIERR